MGLGWEDDRPYGESPFSFNAPPLHPHPSSGSGGNGNSKKRGFSAVDDGDGDTGSSESRRMWQEKYKPRNHVPWTIIGICYGCCMILLLLIRFHLVCQNKLRDPAPSSDEYSDVYIEHINDDGSIDEVKVEKEFLDLTDFQSRDFRHVL
ncbi:hypothetical protein BDP27DRAFT_1235420 [Rhodocollybia butyracea]|uniref:Uncharacterized protein n=1 Tax=Rhodocollybia butyracea TaxID=206335 RepID=A0A9P5U0I8_9AGAR|nr:hypothetical protein BDP27DRAFT_1235420 [Rhodocollybia butyracea]